MARKGGDEPDVAWGNLGDWLDGQLDMHPHPLPPAPSRPTLEDLVERAAADPGRLAYYLCEEHPDSLASRLGIDAHHVTHLQLCWLPSVDRWDQGVADVAFAVGVGRAALDALLREVLARAAARYSSHGGIAAQPPPPRR